MGLLRTIECLDHTKPDRQTRFAGSALRPCGARSPHGSGPVRARALPNGIGECGHDVVAEVDAADQRSSGALAIIPGHASNGALTHGAAMSQTD
jgi:hypothetical protein